MLWSRMFLVWTVLIHRYQSACRSGDYSKALASLRRFYDYQPPGPGRTKGEANGQHQHALLNLANLHYTTGGLDVAKAVCTRGNQYQDHAHLSRR